MTDSNARDVAPRLDQQAAAVLPELAARAAETERLGQLSDENAAILLNLGIPRLFVPRRWGGVECSLPEVMHTVATLARGCMSTAWCAAVYAEHPWLLAHFDIATQEEVWSEGPDVFLSLSQAAKAQARCAPGGFELTGSWGFVSGCDRARWFLFGAPCEAPAGSEPKRAVFLIPREDVEIDQSSWLVAGLRGTGSKTVSIKGAFVPNRRVLRIGPTVNGLVGSITSDSPALFRQPLSVTFGPCLAAIALGGAEAALERFREAIATRVLHLQGRVQALEPAAQMDLAEAAVRIRMARLLLDDGCELARRLGEDSAGIGPLEVAAVKLQRAQAVRLCVEAVERLFASSGGGALQESSPLQRVWRDVHAVQAHAGLNWNSHAHNYGSMAVGQGTTLRQLW